MGFFRLVGNGYENSKKRSSRYGASDIGNSFGRIAEAAMQLEEEYADREAALIQKLEPVRRVEVVHVFVNEKGEKIDPSKVPAYFDKPSTEEEPDK